MYVKCDATHTDTSDFKALSTHVMCLILTRYIRNKLVLFFTVNNC